MAEEPQVRVFTKVVDGETKTRTVTSASGVVAALFDGFVEQASTTSAKSTPAKAADSSKAANTAG